MVLNVIKGPYPSLIQISKDLMLDPNESTTVERGMLVYEAADATYGSVWKVADAANAGTATEPGAFVHFALQPEDDLVAGMAGGVPTTGGDPKLSALACSPTIEIETDMFVTAQASNLTVGVFATVADGGLLTPAADGNTAYLQVTKAPYTRWVNNAPAVVGWRTGNNVSVLRGRTMYVPNLQTA